MIVEPTKLHFSRCLPLNIFEEINESHIEAKERNRNREEK